MLDAHRSLTYELTNEIGFSIVNGNFPYDEKFLTEEGISKKFSVSKNVVREVIKILYAKGLLVSNSRNGIKLNSSSEWSLFDPQVLIWILRSHCNYKFLPELIVLQKAVEPEAARLAAKNYDDADKINAIALALRHIEGSASDRESLISAEINFHIAVLAASKNPYFLQMHNVIETAIRMRYSFQGQSIVTVKLHYQYYRTIFEAIEIGEQEQAAKLTTSMLNLVSEVTNSLSVRS